RRGAAAAGWRWAEEGTGRAPAWAAELLGPPSWSGRVAAALARRAAPGGWAGAVARGLSSLRRGLAAVLCNLLVHAGPLGRWAYLAHWRSAFALGIVEAA